ncbi:hypothetical protein [Novosphingobium sp. Gsoil 351]|uniref:hypothetical protein n=1 Tax=Novosphingobium sp. Gsoil 351 TaxID=2675225 RepID=UPI0012B4C356|nr:hypothetical protein [Novosphingobium sp. Gsoil 351]QGN54246.1 hypothetical protein GKE62_06480 [Novosphingobium sp. Gsoil 351]
MTHAPAAPLDEGCSHGDSRIEEALAALSRALAILDALELPSIATHVSLAYELGKEHCGALAKPGGPQPTEAEIS